ncbi:M1 family metallopeptidase [Granulicella tundricola]|uniref:Peptidase M1 membrane alanine aminopeptidase n=1 Tax=Granulicella tundricola (strain ATCC BAA-1859 / DSM 23138 / MP5ACTX9) TaxID=1198114 RepID=E8X2A5_GRATM|nr:M1 family metallopeptidase [Granulicella tundricola]ADW68037.1 Peptidase M1 membrane alanine aminopeptidase [Granulicella tundricola MP5ACTX9]
MRPLFTAATLLFVAFAAKPGHAQSIATNSPTPLSTRVVAYNLDAKVDMDKKALDATETLTYKNLTGQPLTTFPFHLYLNAFRPESSFTSETHFGGGIRDSESANDYPAKKLGGITIASIAADGMGDLTKSMHFTAPDDNNQNDHTVAEIALPRPLAPGDSITFHIAFHDQFPESIARNGYKRDFLMGGQWYPKLGVFWHGAWNCHQYHSTTEFFSDFATFNVRLTLPRRFTVGASGVPTGDQANSDGTKTLSFYGEDIGDFAFAASPHFTVTDGTFLSSLGPVQVHVLALAAHPDAGQRYLKILLASLDQFDKRYGPYPYKVLTLIDPEPDSQIGGMEYPTLVTGDTNVWDPSHVTELTAEHEFGHQYWYGMVATNEFEDAWLDEGINSYTEVNVLAAILGPRTSFFQHRWANAGDAELQYLQYISEPDYDPVTRHAWQFRNAASYGGVTYGKTATLLKTLEGIVGRDTMDEAMRTYFMRYRFTHPTSEDFLHTIEDVAIKRGKATALASIPGTSPTATQPSTQLYGLTAQPNSLIGAGVNLGQYQAVMNTPGQPNINVGSTLRPFFNQAVYGTRILDFAVDKVTSDPAQWWKAEHGQTQFLDTVTLHRLGDFQLPVTVEIVFEDGTKLRETWDCTHDINDRWHTFTYTRGSKVLSAELDPDHTVSLDRDHFNDSYTTKANHVPAHKLTNIYASALQFASQLAGWLV